MPTGLAVYSKHDSALNQIAAAKHAIVHQLSVCGRRIFFERTPSGPAWFAKYNSAPCTSDSVRRLPIILSPPLSYCHAELEWSLCDSPISDTDSENMELANPMNFWSLMTLKGVKRDHKK